MKTIEINNGMGSRNLYHVNLLLCPGMGIVKFTGVSIPPVLRILTTSYEQNGKWSKTIWEVEIPDEYELVPYSQDWWNGEWFPVQSWDAAVERLSRHFNGALEKSGVTEEMVIRAIRSIFPKSSEKIDQAEREFQEAGDVLGALLEAQERLQEVVKEEAAIKAVISQMEEAERLQQEAKERAARVAAANKILNGGKAVNLADLKSAMGIAE